MGDLYCQFAGSGLEPNGERKCESLSEFRFGWAAWALETKCILVPLLKHTEDVTLEEIVIQKIIIIWNWYSNAELNFEIIKVVAEYLAE